MRSGKRDMEKRSEISCIIEELSMLVVVKAGENHESAHIPTKPFLSVCYVVLQVLGKFINFISLNVQTCDHVTNTLFNL